jgi:hypothetical protein
MSFERQQSPGKSSETVAARPDRTATYPSRTDNPLLDRQRTLGNQAVQRLLLTGTLQAKLRVGRPNDAYEQEADRVADTVMRMPEPDVQRQRTEEDEEEDIRTEPVAEGISPLVQRQAEAPEAEEEEEEEPPQTEAAPGQVQPMIQRQEAEPAAEEEEEEEPQAVQRKAKGADITHVRNAAQVQRLRSPSGGSPLSGGVRSFFERRFGYDFSEVRIHDTYRDRADAASLNARAFTYGKHIWLGAGESTTDSRLMAHELTHVVQQDTGVRRRPLAVSPITPRIQRQFGWVKGLKDRALGKLAQWAKRIPGFDLLTVILGKDPITDEPVERNAINLTRGVLGLIPGGAAIFENLEKAGAITRAFEWLDTEISKLNLTWDAIKGLFRAAWEALDLGDIVDPAGGLEKLRQIFGPPLARIVNFAFAAGQKILEFIFEGVLSLAGGFGPRVMAIVRRAGGVFSTIIKDPIKFLGNLITAIRGGFERFSDNILDHLRTGLLQWLLGALSGAGLTPPDKWDLKGFVSIIVQVLGLSYDKSVRPRLVKLIGERGVAFIEGVFDFVKTLVTGGLSAAWEKILEYAENLQEMVIGAIRDWVAKSVVGAAITKLITMFNPVGAIIQGIMTIYNTIVFFIERAQQIAELVEAVFDSIANIAAGNLGAAISYVERTMGRALPVIIGFLARLIGLGGISDRIKQIIEKVQAIVDMAIDKVVDFIVKRVRGLLGRPEPDRAASPATELQNRLDDAVSEVSEKANELGGVPEPTFLDQVKAKYQLTELSVRGAGDELTIDAAASPPKQAKLYEVELDKRAEFKIIQNPAHWFPREVQTVLNRAQKTISSSNTEEGFGDGSSALAAIAEQVYGSSQAGRFSASPQSIPEIPGSTRHFLKCADNTVGYVGHIRALQAAKIQSLAKMKNLHPEIDYAVRLLQSETRKNFEAVTWCLQYRSGNPQPLPDWAAAYEGLLLAKGLKRPGERFPAQDPRVDVILQETLGTMSPGSGRR